MRNATSSPASWWTQELRVELEAVYVDVDREIESSGVVCWTRSLCCDFDKVDHVLYASSVELAYVRELHGEGFSPDSTLCPFWKERLCTLRARRPLGCRTYFCDEGYREALEAIYEKYHGRLREITERHGVPWRYVPFVTAVRGMGEDAPPEKP